MGKYLSGYQGQLNPALATTILSGQQESAAIQCGGLALCGIFVPTGFTGTALTFEASPDGVAAYVPVKSTTSGSALSYTVAAGEYIAIDPKDFQGIAFLKIKSGTAEGADRTVNCAMKGF